MIYALDTNIVTALLKDNEAVLHHATIATSHGNELIIPPIVDYEIRRGLADERFQKRLARFEKLLEVIRIGTFNLPVWRKAAQIYHSLAIKGCIIEDADILIAAKPSVIRRALYIQEG
jgi:tRNA(fMet)-specific endonuclease VapC